MTYCNIIPIAASCYVHKNVVSDTLDAIFTAIYDLINMGKNITLKLGFINIYFADKNMTYNFNPELKGIMSNVQETTIKTKEESPLLVKIGKTLLLINGKDLIYQQC